MSSVLATATHELHGVSPSQTGHSIPLRHALVDDTWMSNAERKLFKRAQALVSVLAQREAKCVAAREMPAETMDDFRRLGILRILQPGRFGGFQGSTMLFSRIVEELTFGCPSSAWVFAVFGEHAWIVASFPEEAQLEVWEQNPDAVACSSLAPRAEAQSVPGGYRLSGRYPFASGCVHAQWVVVGAFCQDENAKRHQRYVLIPIDQVKILDDWNALGLRGTGSCTLILDDVFIPAHRSVPLTDLLNGNPPGRTVHPDYSLLRAPRTLLAVFSQPPVSLALGRRALDFVSMAIRNRVSRGVTKIAESQVVQMKVAEAAAEIDLAALVMHSRRKRSVELIELGAAVPDDEVLATRRDVVFAQRLVRSAVEALCEISSTELVYDSSPLQSYLRDILTTSTHFSASWETGMVPYGRMHLGLDPVVMET